MTWIIGGNTLFGYSYAISDIRVSWGFRELDCLQKFHLMGNYIAAGFAGSVSLGFKMLDDLKAYLGEPCGELVWVPEYVANDWSRHAKYIFKNASFQEKEAGCQILMIAASPERNDKTVGGTNTHVIKFTCPDFEPYFAKQTEVISIGSGSVIEKFKDALGKINNMSIEHAQVQKLNEHGLASYSMIRISEILKEYPQSGISKHIQVFTVSNSKFGMGNNDMVYFEKGEEKRFKMPEVIKHKCEFNAFCKSKNLKAGAAVT
jgi:hypothetical protein